MDIILKDFKKYGKDKPEDALKTLQSFCSESNVIKSKDVLKLKQLFADGKYGIFLGKFDNYYITNYNKIYDTDVEKTYYEVDVKLEAPYNTMIYNSIQFDEMYYPENSGDPCYIIYRWILVKTDDKYIGINLHETGRIEYKITWKEDDQATVEDINQTYNYVRDLLKKVNSENKKN